MSERAMPQKEGDVCFFVESGVLTRPAIFRYWSDDGRFAWLDANGHVIPVERRYIWLNDDLKRALS